MASILLVALDPPTELWVCGALRDAGHDVRAVADWDAALSGGDSAPVSVVVFDTGLDAGYRWEEGFRRLRSQHSAIVGIALVAAPHPTQPNPTQPKERVRTVPRSDPASLAAGVAGAIVTRRSRRPNDERLAALHARVLQGDREAADEIALLLLPDVRRGVRSAAPREDPHAIDTVVDDAVMVHLREPAAFDPARASLVSWLVAIALNKLQGLQRSRRRRLAHEQPEGVDFSQKPVSVSADDDAAARERKMARWAAALRAAVRTPRERALVEARLAGAGFDAQATAYGIEGLPKAKARVVLYRAWENLVRRARRILKREDADAG